MDICFVSLPFTPIVRPMLSFGILQAILKKENIKAPLLQPGFCGENRASKLSCNV